MGMSLYVRNLSHEVTDADLGQLFSQYGAVRRAQVIKDKMTSRGTGFGFVAMSSDQEARAARASLDGTDHSGRVLIVSEAGRSPSFFRELSVRELAG